MNRCGRKPFRKVLELWRSFSCGAFFLVLLLAAVALAALTLYPLVWLLLLPFRRVVGIAVGGALELVSAIILLPVRLVRAI